MAHSTFTKIASIIVLVLMFAMMVTCFMPLAHGSVAQPRPNSLGLEPVVRNPMAYMFGTIIHVESFPDVTGVVFQPFGAPLIYKESILFCSDIERQLDQRTETTLYLFTYREQVSRLYKRIPCHDVYRIIEIRVKGDNQ